MQIYFHSRLCSYLPRVPILVEGTVTVFYLNILKNKNISDGKADFSIIIPPVFSVTQ